MKRKSSNSSEGKWARIRERRGGAYTLNHPPEKYPLSIMIEGEQETELKVNSPSEKEETKKQNWGRLVDGCRRRECATSAGGGKKGGNL